MRACGELAPALICRVTRPRARAYQPSVATRLVRGPAQVWDFWDGEESAQTAQSLVAP